MTEATDLEEPLRIDHPNGYRVTMSSSSIGGSDDVILTCADPMGFSVSVLAPRAVIADWVTSRPWVSEAADATALSGES